MAFPKKRASVLYSPQPLPDSQSSFTRRKSNFSMMSLCKSAYDSPKRDYGKKTIGQEKLKYEKYFNILERCAEYKDQFISGDISKLYSIQDVHNYLINSPL